MALLGPCSRVGGLGTAQAAHACRQLVSAATAIGMSEAMMIAERAGLDAAALGVSRAADQVAAAGLDDQDLSTAYRILAAQQPSGKPHDDNHQNDNHQNADNETNQSPVHRSLLS